MDNFSLSISVLLTGAVVVFSVLVLLIFVIKLYSFAVRKLSEKLDKNQKNENKSTQTQKPLVVSENIDESSIPPEVIAVIAAAVDSVYGAGNCRIKSVRRSKENRPAWRSAGILESTKPFTLR